MGYAYKAPRWDAKGVEPTSELKEKGFQAGYKPPADYFNYMFNQYSNCIDELQNSVPTDHTHIVEMQSGEDVPIEERTSDKRYYKVTSSTSVSNGTSTVSNMMLI